MTGAKPALQARSKQTRDLLVAALERLLRDKPFEEISVTEIAKEAGVSVGAIYRRFENKDAFIPVIFELYRDRLTTYERDSRASRAAGPSPGLQAALHRSLAFAWTAIERDGHLMRAVHLYARIRPELVGEEWVPLVEASRNGVRMLLQAHADELTVPDLETAVEAVTYFLNTILIEAGLYPHVGPPLGDTLAGEPLVHEMANFAFAYLTMPR